MNFYKRFVADIQVKTGHLTPAEFGIYDRLLDHYYATEALLPSLERCCAIARAMTKADKEAVARVLAEFFTQEQGGCYSQRRADEMIAEAQPKIAAAKANGKRGGRPKRTQPKPSGLQNGTQQEPNTKASQNQTSSNEEEPPSGVQGGKVKASKRCPQGFKPEGWEAMQLECPGVSIARETEKFRDWEFHRARTDWQAAWRVWMRKAFDDLQARPTGETNYARSMREKYEEVAPLVAASKPGQVRPNPMDVIEGMTREPIRIAR